MGPSGSPSITSHSHLGHTDLKKVKILTLKRYCDSKKFVYTRFAAEFATQPPITKGKKMNGRHILLGNSLSTVKTKINQRQQRYRKLVMFTSGTFGIAGLLVYQFVLN